MDHYGSQLQPAPECRADLGLAGLMAEALKEER
jgi:hypothetical protein